MDPPTDVPPFVLPSPTALSLARSKIHTHLPATGQGHVPTTTHLTSLTPGFSASSRSSRYYGFVTGGCTPTALFADHLVSTHDQNVQVHLPNETIATDVEAAALGMMCQLFGLEEGQWAHRTFTTGATAGNVLGLAEGREAVVRWAGARRGREGISCAERGLVGAMKGAGVEEVRVLTCEEHSSLRKACSVVGLGHGCLVDVGRKGEASGVDLGRLREELGREGRASIIAVSCAEVNTGLFATGARGEMEEIRRLADEFGAWVHVDAAFGLLAKVLPDGEEFEEVKRGVEGMELADSIAGDAHKLFNVPYDCGFFLSKHLDVGTQVFQNPGAPYLSAAAGSIPSPLNIGLENSRRFRALPIYANLVAYGQAGYREMLERQVRFSRRIAQYMLDSDAYELLPATGQTGTARLASIYIIVLFRAKDVQINDELIKRINDQRKIYCSGTKWGGKPAVRFAVSNWQVDIDKDWPVVEEVLNTAIYNK